jgi:type IV pilus assembly protein PilN
VILINLLPHREAARKRRKDAFYVSLGIAALLGGLICGAVYGWYQAQISSQQNKNLFLQGQIKTLETQIKDVANLQSEIAALRARQQAVEDLQSDRNIPVNLLNELVKQLPDGVYVDSMKQDGVNLTLLGVAQSNERISELLRNLANNSTWLTKPELVQIVAKTVTLSPRDQRRVADFTIKARITRPAEAAKAAASAASAVIAEVPVAKPAVSASAASSAKKA